MSESLSKTAEKNNKLNGAPEGLLTFEALTNAVQEKDELRLRKILHDAALEGNSSITDYNAERAWRYTSNQLRLGNEANALLLLNSMPVQFKHSSREKDAAAALNLASQMGLRIASEKLLDMDANPNWQPENGKTALMHMVQFADKRLFDKSISKMDQAGIQKAMTLTDHDQMSAPMYAVISKASIKAREDILKTSQGLGFNINAPIGRELYTASHLAALTGDIHALEMAAKLGCDLQKPSRNGYTPLMCAAFANRPNAIEKLVELGADPNLPRANDGLTASHIAASKGYLEALTTLHKKGANLRARTLDTEDTPASFAREVGKAQIAAQIDKIAPPPANQNSAFELMSRINKLITPNSSNTNKIRLDI